MKTYNALLPLKNIRSYKRISIFLIALCVCTATFLYTRSRAATTYTWNQTGTASYATSTNWTPTRTTPAVDDVLVFNNGATTTVTNVPTQTIGQLSVSGNTTVNLQANAASTVLTIGGGAGTDLSVASGSALNMNGANTMTITLSAGATGSFSGNMTCSAAASKLDAADASAITFNSGVTVTQASGCTGNIFTSAGTANAIVFASGSTFIQQTGANPFGLGAPNSKVVFQTGSLFSFQQNALPSFSGRTYANLEINSATYNQTSTGGSAFSVDNLTITAGVAHLQLTNVTIKGNISVASGQTLDFNPTAAAAISLAGTSAQTITNSGTLTFNSNANITVNNANGVTLNSPITLPGTLTLTSGKITTSASNLLTVTNTSAASAVSGGSATAYVKGPLARTLPANLVTGSTYSFPVGKGGFNPFELINPTTGAGGTITTQAEVFDANAGGTPGTGITTLNTNRYWQTSVSGAGSFTSTQVRLTDSTGGNRIGQSATQTGTYNSIGGTVVGSTITSNSITSPAGFFVIGNFVAETDVSVSGGNLVITDGNGGTSDDTLTLSRSGANVRINDPSNTLSAGAGATQVDANTVDVPLASISGQIQVNTLGGNDTLTLNLASGNFFPAGGVSYAGGTQTSSDKLVITGGNQGTVVYNYTNANDGSISMSNFGTVSYTGLEPITNTGTPTDVVFNLPAGPTNATLGDDGTPGNSMSRLSGATFETTDFANPTGSLTINRGNSADTLAANALPDFDASLTLGTSLNPFSTITFTGGVTLATNKNLSGNATGTISLSTANSDLATTGTGTISLTTERNITLAPGSSVTVVNGNLTLDANQQASPTAGNFIGISVNGATLTTSGTGNISLRGKGGADAATALHIGIRVNGGSTINSTSAGAGAGTITLDGTGGQGTAANRGVQIENPGTTITSPTGDISITGHGANATTTTNYGVHILSGAAVSSTGAAKITINGTGGSGTSSNTGARVSDDNTQVTSSGGDISITGQGGGSGSSNHGVSLAFGALVSATGGAKIIVNGTGGSGTASNVGIVVSSASTTNVGTKITSNSGDIQFTGQGGAGSDVGNIGWNIDSSANVVATGSANISINGTGGSGTTDNYGVGFEGGSTPGTGVSAVNGNINITGVSTNPTGTDEDGVRFEDSVGAQAVSVTTTGTGTLTINGTAGNSDPTSAGINIVDDTSMSLTGATNTFIADTMDFGTSNTSVNAGSNALTLRQKTNGIAIDLGGADSATQLGLTDTELDIINAGTLNIGNGNSGAITVSAGISRAASTILNLTSGGAINLNASSLNSGGGNVSLTPGASASVNPTAAGTDVSMSTTGTLSFTSGADLAIQINGTTVDTQYRQLGVVGGVNLTGVDLVLSGLFTPSPGQSFTVVNNDGADAITGIFNGLPEGATIPNFLGSTFSAKITYIGGDGNDVVLNIPTPPKYRSRQSGNWNDFNTWQVDTGGGFVNATAGQTPTSADDTIEIQSPHTVNVTANVDADQLTVDSGGTLSVNNGVIFTVADGAGTDLTDNGTVATAGNITDNGQAQINNILQINEGGFPGSGTGTYSYDQTNATLVFNNSTGPYGVNNNNYWPSPGGPQNVTVQNTGGIQMNVARTVGLLFQYAAGVSGAGNLTLNGTSQVNNGGFTSGSPTYGPSSLLKYNVNTSYGRNGEWLPNVTSGAGYPNNVQLSNNTNLDLPNGSSNASFQLAGNLTIDSGSTMNLNGSPAMTQPLTVLGSVINSGTLNLSTALGGDIKVGGNWQRTQTATFNPNGRAVFFNGGSTQTIKIVNGGIETFSFLIVDKPGGNLQLDTAANATNIIVNGGTGDVLQILNAGGIDMNGQGLTLQTAGGNIRVSGGARSIVNNNISTTSTFAFSASKTVTSAAGGTLTFGTNINVVLNAGVDFGPLLSTVNGTLTVGSGGFVNTNAPTYGPASTLLYDCTCVFSRGAEWTSATSGPGAPNNVTTNTNTDLDLGSTTPNTALQAAGSIDARNGSRFLMVLDDNSHAMTAALTVLGNVLVESGGTLRLSSASGGDLKVRGDFTNNGTFTPNNRAVFFEGTAVQNVNAISGTVTMPYVRVNKGGGTVTLQSNLTTLGPSGGDSIQFLGTTNTVTLNGRTLTLGSTVGTPPAGSGLIGDAGAILTLQDGGTGPGGPMGTIAFVSPGQILDTLTINRTGANANATLGTDLTINDAFNLTSGDINTGSNTITDNGTDSGIGDVVGNVKRTSFTNGLHATNNKSFGNPNVQLSFQTGTPATDVVVNLVKSRPTGAGFGYPSAVNRTYTVTQTGASAFTATLRLHYLDSELGGNTEALLDLWRFNGTTWSRVTKTGADILTANNKWIESAAVTQLSPWTLASQPLAPTAARLRELRATAYRDGMLVEWQTGFEVDNLGFRLYRDDAGRRTLVTPNVVAGSALAVGPKTVLGAGNAYSWVDPNGTQSSAYWLEDINTDGQTELSGPFYPSGASRARMPKRGLVKTLDQLGSTEQQTWQHQWWPAATSAASSKVATRAASAEQNTLASGPAVKLLVRRAGWYRVTRAQLLAAGLSPAADPTRLQLFADGVEQAIRVNADDWQSSGSIEFYGEGLDKPATDTRVYWLVEGSTAGRRTTAGAQSATPGAPGAQGAGQGGGSTEHVVPGITVEPPEDPNGGFPYTTELKERTLYFSSLLNGEAENFFGRVITSTPVSETIAVRNLGVGGKDQLVADQALLEVSLQGVTEGAHEVRILFNGTEVGTVNFAGRERQSATFAFEPSILREGDNQLQFASAASGDISLTDYVRLTYQHKFSADDDALRFTANTGQQVRVGGFSTGVVRVVDITDPNNVSEVQGVEPEFDATGGGWAVTLQPGGTGTRTLLAVANAKAAAVDGVFAHTPTDLRGESNEADFVIVTHPAFRESVAPLAERRQAEGLATKVVSVDDIFDEFSAGEHSPQAVKDFLAYTSQHWKRAPRYVLFVGDGSLDPRNYLGHGSFDLVPAKLVDTTNMETASDNWYADFNGDGLAEMAVGRLPVRTVAEANTVITKILGYVPGNAQQGALLVADRTGADGYSFESATDGVQSLLPAGTVVQRINRGAQSGDAVRAQVVSGINTGPSVVNWMGHGSVNVWTGDGLLRNDDAPSLTNGQHLSLFVMMTCLNGYFQDPSLDGLAETLLKAQNGGAVAAWSSTGMTEPEGQAAMNAELYRALFAGTGPLRLGDAMQRARSATTDADVLRTWVLIGDPTTRWR